MLNRVCNSIYCSKRPRAGGEYAYSVVVHDTLPPGPRVCRRANAGTLVQEAKLAASRAGEAPRPGHFSGRRLMSASCRARGAARLPFRFTKGPEQEFSMPERVGSSASGVLCLSGARSPGSRKTAGGSRRTPGGGEAPLRSRRASQGKRGAFSRDRSLTHHVPAAFFLLSAGSGSGVFLCPTRFACLSGSLLRVFFLSASRSSCAVSRRCPARLCFGDAAYAWASCFFNKNEILFQLT